MKEKIRKLLAMANDPGASENERAIASRQAAALMTKHDIDLDALAEAELKEEFDLTTGEAPGCRPGKKGAREVPQWIGFIAWGVKLYTRTRAQVGAGVIYFKGPREDVELAQWLHTVLVKDCYTQSQGRSQSDASAFRNGFAGAIQQRFKRMVRDREQSDAAGSLVLYKGKRDRIMDEAYGPEAKGRAREVKQTEEGRAAGANASIPSGRPITQSHLRLN